MLRAFTSPHHYIQGPGALGAFAEVLQLQDERAFVIVDEQVYDLVSAPLCSSLQAAGTRYEVLATTGEVTSKRIVHLAEIAEPLAPTVIVAAGGGKTLDSGKGVARVLGCRIVTVPTIASNDGPTSRVIATYDDDHRLVDTPQMRDNPYAVVVDTTLIARAPAHFLRSGIGDAIAKRYEAGACQRGDGLTSNGTRPLLLPAAIAARCYDVLLEHSSEALADVSKNTTSNALEAVVEAVILMSGLAFENGGLSLAHSMTRGLMRIPGAANKPHGYQVAYGLTTQLMHEREFGEYTAVRSFLSEVGLPVTLRDLGTDSSPEVMATVIEATLSAPHMANCVPRPSELSLLEAMQLVEAGRLP